MIAEFVLILSLVEDFGPSEKYEATFSSCKEASEYYETFYRGKKEYNGYRCIRKDLVVGIDKLKLGI
jgi:hypothetical protein